MEKLFGEENTLEFQEDGSVFVDRDPDVFSRVVEMARFRWKASVRRVAGPDPTIVERLTNELNELGVGDTMRKKGLLDGIEQP